MLSVTNKSFMLSVIMLSVIMHSVVAPCVEVTGSEKHTILKYRNVIKKCKKVVVTITRGKCYKHFTSLMYEYSSKAKLFCQERPFHPV
jgi:hypothetical protein